MGATLSLSKRAPDEKPEAPEHGPAFDRDAHYGEVMGVPGVKYVQGKAFFNHLYQYIEPAPKHMWLAPLTAEQEAQRRRQAQANKKFFGPVKNLAPAAAIPQEIINAERENAKARAVEALAS